MLPTALLLVNTAFAQEIPEEVTESQVAVYQRGMDMGCKDAGRRRGDPAEKVDAFCNCVAGVLKENVTQSEWQQAYFYFRKRQEREEMRALSAHTAKIRTCKANAF